MLWAVRCCCVSPAATAPHISSHDGLQSHQARYTLSRRGGLVTRAGRIIDRRVIILKSALPRAHRRSIWSAREHAVAHGLGISECGSRHRNVAGVVLGLVKTSAEVV